MKKLLKITGISIATLLLSYGLVRATVSPFPVSYSNWIAGNTITSAWLNTIEQMIGTGSTSTSLTSQIVAIKSSTSTTLGQLSTATTTTGGILIASSSTGWNILAVGPNGYCPMASSTAPLGVAWAICSGSINGTTALAYNFAAGGTGLSVSTTGATTTYTIASSSYLQPSNNLSELTNTSTARTSLGLGNLATQSAPSSGIVTSNGTSLSSASVVPVASGGTATTTAPTDGQYLGANGSIPTYKSFVGGNNVSIATSSTSTVISVVTTAAAAGSDKDVQFNNGGTFGTDTGVFTYASSTHTLNLNNLSVSTTTVSNSTILNGNVTGTGYLSVATSSGAISGLAYNTSSTSVTLTAPATGKYLLTGSLAVAANVLNNGNKNCQATLWVNAVTTNVSVGGGFPNTSGSTISETFSGGYNYITPNITKNATTTFNFQLTNDSACSASGYYNAIFLGSN